MRARSMLLAATLALLARPAGAADFTVSSADIANGGHLPADHVFNGFGCAGANRSPALAWSGAPAETKSFAVTVYDPDAPTGSGWWHWVVINLPAGTTGLPTGAGDPGGALLPAGAVQGRTDFGTAGYGGACPPAGDPAHRYIFTVHALNVETLEVPADASPALIGFMLNGTRIARTSLTAYYAR
ncbi:MAG: YbhB/YbcL family Raf kinase inhibitor-like protein [Dongiaceae bacterium]